MGHKVMCMSFDGEYKLERPVFDSIEEARHYDGLLGSKWFFYPSHFIVTETGKTVVDAGDMLWFLERRRVKTVQKMFKKQSQKPEMQDADPEYFMIALAASF